MNLIQITKCARTTSGIAVLVMLSMIFPVFAFGQDVKSGKIDASLSAARFLINISDRVADDSTGENVKQTGLIARSLKNDRARNPVLIDIESETSLSIISRAARDAGDVAVYAINWDAIFGDAYAGGNALASVNEIIAFAAASKGKVAIYLNNVEGFSRESSPLGAEIAAKLYAAIKEGKIKVVGAATKEQYNAQIEADEQLRGRFAKIELSPADKDPFVGDKLSPDLREIVGSADPNKRVKVILQSDDIGNPELARILKDNKVAIQSRAENLDMMVVELPVRAAEAVANARGSRHLSLDREIKLFGHVETTTGTSLVRTIQQGLNVNLLGIGVANTSSELDGKDIGIAIVDSGIREDHRSFINSAGARRVVRSVDFSNTGNINADRYGHGTHVASLAAGGTGQNLNATDGLYMNNYEGVASNAKIINVKVLSDQGVGSTASFINAINWIYENRTQHNIRVVNLSLGAPAIETWRNDPLCRAASDSGRRGRGGCRGQQRQTAERTEDLRSHPRSR